MEKKFMTEIPKQQAQEITDNIITSNKDIIEDNTNTNIPDPTSTPVIEEDNKNTDNKIEETPQPTEEPKNKPVIIDRLYRF